MAQVVSSPQRFTHDEWVLSNNTNYSSAEVQRARAERLRSEADRLIQETTVITDKTQTESTKRIDQRLDDVSYWKNELDNQLTAEGREIENLLGHQKRLEAALQATFQPMEIAKQCLQYRENRKTIDLVHDEVQKELIKEVEVIAGVQGLLQKTLEQCQEQTRLCRSAKYYLEKDLQDKFGALEIDTLCHELTNDAPIIKHTTGVAKIEPNSTTPADWQSFSNENILKAERQRNNGIDLRAMIDSILEQVHSDLQKQCDAVDAAFRRRIIETHSAHDSLQEHLQKVNREIGDLQETIEKLKCAIAEKEPPLKLAETRLQERAARPNIELCRDAPQYRLIGEVGEINESMQRLRETLCQAEREMKGLVRNQLRLEEDIDVKQRTLEIDEQLCVPARKLITHVCH